MEHREAAKWFALFVLLVGGWFAYEHFFVVGNKAFGITREMNGEPISVQATVVSISGGKGHIFPILRDPSNNKTIKSVLFRDDNNPLENREQQALLETKRREGTPVTIDGEVCIYQGNLEIIIRKAH